MKRITTVFLVLSVTLTALFTPFFNVNAEEQNEISIEEMLFEPAYTPAERSTQNANNSGISPRAIIGGDSRSLVEDVSLSPYCKIVYIKATFSSGVTKRATGFILGPDLIVTAGHALYSGTYGGMAVSCKVYFETDGVAPQNPDALSTEIYVPDEYADLLNPDRKYYDWGYIIVNKDVGKTQGWFGFGTITGTQSVTVAGYPEFYPEENRELEDKKYNYSMVEGTGRAMSHPYNNELLVRHDVDTAVGQSGSPIYNESQVVLGIHSLSILDVNGDGIYEQNNVGIKINSEIFQLLKAKKDEGRARWSS